MRLEYFTGTNDYHNWDLICSLWEDFTQKSKLSSNTGSLKRKAAKYLGTSAEKKLTRTEFRTLLAKAHKMKTSNKKEERQRGIQLARQIQTAFNQ
jgi:hypothetical protein